MKILENDYSHLGFSIDHSDTFIEIFDNIISHGKKVKPRGQEVIEIENFKVVLDPYVRFCNFKSRKLKVDYCREELKWYLRGDKYDTSICDHANMWKGLINDDGSINSNYGQYIFGELNQFNTVLSELINDKDSRRASIIILQPYHTNMSTNDVPCTYGINFRIRDNKLNMTVMMRSNDVIYGFTNDCPIFSIIHELLYNCLLKTYPDLMYGEYCHFTNSMHVYERHYDMVNDIRNDDDFELVYCPKISGYEEAEYILKNKGNVSDDIKTEWKFCKWLRGDELYEVDAEYRIEAFHDNTKDWYAETEWSTFSEAVSRHNILTNGGKYKNSVNEPIFYRIVQKD